nr:MAG TPA: hypothetical protein [Caudoviricetes sp.]
MCCNNNFITKNGKAVVGIPSRLRRRAHCKIDIVYVSYVRNEVIL